jgi:PEP-CTERM motif
MRASAIAFLSTFSLVACALSASAAVVVPVTLNPGNIEVRAQVDDTISCTYVGAAVGGCTAGDEAESKETEVNDGASHAGATATISDDPSVDIQVDLDPGNDSLAEALVTTTYQFHVNGKTGNPVSVVFIGAISITDVNASGRVTAGSVGYTIVGPGVNGGQSEFINSNAHTQHLLDKYIVLGGSTYTVTLSANADLNEGSPNCCIATPGHTASVTGNLDPTVTIDPSSPDASAFSLQFSPGFGPATAVPEPSTWAMMLVGFTSLGFCGLSVSSKNCRDRLSALATGNSAPARNKARRLSYGRAHRQCPHATPDAQGLDWTDKYPSIIAALANLNVKTVYLDGELRGVDDAGLPSFAHPQAATDGERKALLEPLIAGKPGLQFNGRETGDGEPILKHAGKFAFEGVVSKTSDSLPSLNSSNFPRGCRDCMARRP